MSAWVWLGIGVYLLVGVCEATKAMLQTTPPPAKGLGDKVYWYVADGVTTLLVTVLWFPWLVLGVLVGLGQYLFYHLRKGFGALPKCVTWLWKEARTDADSRQRRRS